MIVTQWFNGFTKPKRKGLYQCSFSGSAWGVMMLYWNGKYWLMGKNSKLVSVFGGYRSDQWRGLAAKP